MPTGYTAAITDDMTLRGFALTCARAFGALITMRDDPADAPIPDEFPAETYHAERLAADRAERARVAALTDRECAAEASAEHDRAVAWCREREAERAATRRRYERMLALVRAWQPPTPDHTGLKDFMVQQITQSIDFDCTTSAYDVPPSAPAPAAEWRAARLADLDRSIARHEEGYAEDVARAAARTAWVRGLRASLP